MLASLLATICSAVSSGSPCSCVRTAASLVTFAPLAALPVSLAASLGASFAVSLADFGEPGGCFALFAGVCPAPSTPVKTPTTPPIAPPSTPPTGPAALLPSLAPFWTPSITCAFAAKGALRRTTTTAASTRRNPSCACAIGVGLVIIWSPWSISRYCLGGGEQPAESAHYRFRSEQVYRRAQPATITQWRRKFRRRQPNRLMPQAFSPLPSSRSVRRNMSRVRLRAGERPCRCDEFAHHVSTRAAST